MSFKHAVLGTSHSPPCFSGTNRPICTETGISWEDIASSCDVLLLACSVVHVWTRMHACLCVCKYTWKCRYMCMCVRVKTRRQPWLSFPRYYPAWFVGWDLLWAWSLLIRLGWSSRSPRGPPISTARCWDGKHCHDTQFYCVRVLGIELRCHACKASTSPTEPSPLPRATRMAGQLIAPPYLPYAPKVTSVIRLQHKWQQRHCRPCAF